MRGTWTRWLALTKRGSNRYADQVVVEIHTRIIHQIRLDLENPKTSPRLGEYVTYLTLLENLRNEARARRNSTLVIAILIGTIGFFGLASWWPANRPPIATISRRPALVEAALQFGSATFERPYHELKNGFRVLYTGDAIEMKNLTIDDVSLGSGSSSHCVKYLQKMKFNVSGAVSVQTLAGAFRNVETLSIQREKTGQTFVSLRFSGEPQDVQVKINDISCNLISNSNGFTVDGDFVSGAPFIDVANELPLHFNEINFMRFDTSEVVSRTTSIIEGKLSFPYYPNRERTVRDVRFTDGQLQIHTATLASFGWRWHFTALPDHLQSNILGAAESLMPNTLDCLYQWVYDVRYFVAVLYFTVLWVVAKQKPELPGM